MKAINLFVAMASQSIQQQALSGNLGGQTMEYPELPGGVTGTQSWQQRALDEMKDMFLLLSADAKIMYASPSCKAITGYTAPQLEGKPLPYFTHKDDRAIFSHELEQSIATGGPLRLHFRFNRMSDSFCILEAYGHPHISNGDEVDGVGVVGVTGNDRCCDGVFLICRPYPTRSSQLLDSFLEHKLENIRLTQQVAKLKEEEDEELNVGRQLYPGGNSSNNKSSYNSTAPRRSDAPNNSATSSSSSFAGTGNILPDASTSAEEYESPDTLTNLDDQDNQVLPPRSIPADDFSHITGIEIMTGLHYGEGERSQGISTGMRRGRLVQCDNPDITTVDQQARHIEEGDRRKRLKGKYQCTDCGTSDSPEWRKGPRGPKTLCNACGCKLDVFLLSRFEWLEPNNTYNSRLGPPANIATPIVRWAKRKRGTPTFSSAPGFLNAGTGA